jgi:hypothetical protein
MNVKPIMSAETNDAAEGPSGFFFLTPVWGAAYVQLYVETVIPAQLSPGNLPTLRGLPNCRYIIFTRLEDAEVIRTSPCFERLSATIPVQFELIDQQIRVIHDMMSECFRRGIRMAEDANASVLLLTPDIVFADGSFGTIRRCAEAGQDVVFIPAIRTTKSAVVRALATHRTPDAISVTPRQLMRIALDNLHPMGDASWWEEGEDDDLIPANLYWRAGDEGIVGHCFHLHPLLVRPQRRGAAFFGTVDDDYVPAACPDSRNDYVVTDSDELLAIELSDPRRYLRTGLAKRSVRDALRWAEQSTNERHRSLFPVRIRMHAGISHPEKWREAEQKAAVVVEQIQSELNRPWWRIGLDFDRLLRRSAGRWKESRLALANGRAGASGLTQLLLSGMGFLMAARLAATDFMRRVARSLEERLFRPYTTALCSDLTSLLATAESVVYFANSSGKSYLLPCIGQRWPRSAEKQHVSIVRHDVMHFFEDGQEIRDRAVTDLVLEIDAYRSYKLEEYLREARRVLAQGGRLVVYLHHVSATPFDQRPFVSAAHIKSLLSPDFEPVTEKQQGGLGTFANMRLSSWAHRLIAQRASVRILFFVLGLPLLPAFVLVAGGVITMRRLLDAVDRSGKYRISELILMRQSSQAP